jgi:histidinol-phosphate aminotransferase
MSYATLLNPQIDTLPVYQPGRPIEVVARELGLNPAEIIKLASNENPLGASPLALEAAAKALKDVWLYPDNGGYDLTGRLAETMGVPFESIVLTAGSNEVFYRLGDLFVAPGAEVVMGAQAFITYRISTLLRGGTEVLVPMPDGVHDLAAMRAAITERTRLVFLPNPNNPTGTYLPADEVLAFAESLPEHVVFCYDEAYAEYQEAAVDLRPLMRAGRKIVATWTFSKIYGLAGFRIGYGYAEAELATLLQKVRPPFNTGSVAQEAALAALDDDLWVQRSRSENEAGLRQMEAGFDQLGFSWTPSKANFILVEVPNAAEVSSDLQQAGVIVRPVAGYGLPNHLRVTIGTAAQNSRCLNALSSVSGSK